MSKVSENTQQMTTFNNVKLFNEIWGKTPPVIGSDEYWAALDNQAKRIQEELDETVRAIANRDMNEVLDGGCDLDVVVSGFNFLHGHEYQGAINAVCGENHTKYTIDYGFAEASFNELYNGNTESHCIVCTHVGGIPRYSIHRNSDDKVCKLLNHPKIDLNEFIRG